MRTPEQLRRLRPHPHRRQLVPQSPLFKMSGRGAGGMAHGAACRVAAGPIFPCRLYLTVGRGRDRLSEQADGRCPAERAAAQALVTLAAKRLPARIGLIVMLHTWGQTLTHHPHVHCLVPAGGVFLDGGRWIACKPATSSYPSMRCRERSAGSSSMAWKQSSVARNSASSTIWPCSRSQACSPSACARCAEAPSSSTPSRRSADPSACSPILPATPSNRHRQFQARGRR